jgi:hypothetical protein
MMELLSSRQLRCALPLLFAFTWAGLAQAAMPDEAKGLWMTAEKDAVIEFRNCQDRAGSLCGRIVWDKDAGTPLDTCGVQIEQLTRTDALPASPVCK